MADTYIALGEEGCSGPLGWGHCFLFSHRLLAVQDGAGSVDGSRSQIWTAPVLVDHMLDSAQGILGILVDGDPHVNGWLHDDNTFAAGCWLHAHCLEVNQPLVMKRVVGLQILGFSAVHLLVPLNQKA